MLQEQSEALHSIFSSIRHCRGLAGICNCLAWPLQAFTVLSRGAFTLRERGFCLSTDYLCAAPRLISSTHAVERHSRFRILVGLLYVKCCRRRQV